MLTLYYLKGACSFVPHYFVLQTPHAESVKVTSASMKEPAYLAINPQGTAPCLVDDGFVVSQATGIVEYLNEKFPELHIWGSGDAKVRATGRRWFGFCNSDLHKCFSPLFAPQKWISDDAAQEALQTKARQNIDHYFKMLDEQLKDKDYLAGEKTAADIYLFTILRWATQAFKMDLSVFPHVERFYQTLRQDPLVQATLDKEGIIC